MIPLILRFHLAVALSLLLPGSVSAALVWETQLIERTATKGDKEVVAVFNFKNTGQTPATIRDIHTGCDCTAAELSRHTYAPGEAGALKTVFKVGDRTGRQERPITVTTDDPTTPISTLVLRVDIPDLLTYSTRMLHWSIGGKADEQSVEVSASGAAHITSLEFKEPALKQMAVRIESAEAGTRYRLHIRPAVLDAPITAGLTFVAVFADGSQRSFMIFALVR